MTTPTNVTFVANTIPAITAAWLNGVNDWVYGWYGVIGETFTATAARTALGIATGTFTTGNITSGSHYTKTLAHGLSTDNLDVGFSIIGDHAVYGNRIVFSLYSIQTDGTILTMSQPGVSIISDVAPVLADIPSAGNLTIKIGNESAATQGYTVKWWARAR